MFALPSNSYLVLVLALAVASSAQTCKLQFDARVAANSTAATFDTSSSVFGTTNVLGKGLKFSQIVKVQAPPQSSLFDKKTVPVELTISDDSIFNNQTGFRRAELQPVSVTGTDPSTRDVKTLHFSVRASATRPLNISHEYQIAFLEDNAFSTNQFVLKTGTILDQNTTKPTDLTLFGNVKDGKILFSTPFMPGVFHNYGLTMDFKANTIAVFYSQDTDPLASVLKPTPNNLTGQGQFHFGLLKKPTNPGADVTKSGFQPTKINEGIVLGGIFEEDSSAGCVSFAP